MSNFQGRDAREVSMASGMLVSQLGELMITKGLITHKEAAAVVQAAQGGASVHPTVSTAGAILVLHEIGQSWEAAGTRKS
ncbi:hypothetical protein MKK75_04055 [Methylobacterium sp. J-030]|uniref:hypothetical protein n=1 Tax=Methylobacterium sp. J-030 TaxID=2836627 RepID=UPI001FB95E7E|nr:hypothetical protein [Methylobacterium sp. J-030]MCJ2067989.1 hypothetical protein [Methylobacterium sp. J-030]